MSDFDVQSDVDIFLGYSAISKVFCVFNKKTLNVEEIIHFVFDEIELSTKAPNLANLSNRIT